MKEALFFLATALVASAPFGPIKASQGSSAMAEPEPIDSRGQYAPGVVRPVYVGAGVYNRTYPQEAIRRREQGDVYIEFLVGLDGEVRDVRILQSSGSAILDEATLRLIAQRYRFRPGRDASGRPAVFRTHQVARWVLPGRNAEPERFAFARRLRGVVYVNDYPLVGSVRSRVDKRLPG